MTNLIVLAAGLGSRLGKITERKPKCLIEFEGIPLLEYIIHNAEQCGIKSVVIVTGHAESRIKEYISQQKCELPITTLHNHRYAETNMVYSLIQALKLNRRRAVISYSDIIYDWEVLDALLNAKNSFTIASDLEWLDLWEKRMTNPLIDAEQFKAQGDIISSIGDKPTSIDEIEGQYIGLFVLEQDISKQLIDLYASLGHRHSLKYVHNLSMTEFIMHYIHNGGEVHKVDISGGWLEFDTPNDLDVYKTFRHQLTHEFLSRG